MAFISDWFIDGPLAAGTEIGTKLAQVTSSAYSSQGLSQNSMGSDLSSGDSGGGMPNLQSLQSGTDATGLSDTGNTNGGNPTGLVDSGDHFPGQPIGQQGTPLNNNSANTLTMQNSGSSGSTDLGQARVQAAVSILLYLHNLGVAGWKSEVQALSVLAVFTRVCQPDPNPRGNQD